MKKLQELYPEQLKDLEEMERKSKKKQNISPFSFREIENFSFEHGPVVLNFVGPED